MATARPAGVPAVNRPAIRRNITGNAAEDKVRRETSADLSRVLSAPFLDGQLIEGIDAPTAGEVTVNHALKRPARGYIVVRAQGGVAAIGDTRMNASTITLYSAVGCKLDLWVF